MNLEEKMSEQIISILKEKIDKTTDKLKEDLLTVRAGLSLIHI